MTNATTYESLESSALVALILERDREIEKLHNHIQNANKKLYGAKSEKLSSDQLKFSFNVPPAPEQKSLEQEVVVERHTRTVRKGRKPLPEDLPREEIIYEPEQTHCPCCNVALVKIGEERSEELEKVPAQLKVIEHVRIKKACPSCKGAGVLVPPLPATVFPIERARPGPGLLADIVISKFVDHIPLYRQEQMYLREGIELPRQRMCEWIGAIVALLAPLYEALKREILALPYIQADETTIKVQDGEEEGKCHTGYLWGLHGPPNLMWFHYAPSRAGTVPKELLHDFSGRVHTDAYAGYNPVFLPERCQRIACLAHVRRKFLELQKVAGKECNRALNFIAQLYKLEQNVKNAQERLSIRVKKSKPLLEELFTYLNATSQSVLPKSPLAGALNYALDQKQELYRIFEHGDCELDNNAIERQMRPVAIGRKNWLFAGSHNGAHNAAVLFSLLNTCKLNKVNPWEWLRDVLIRVSSERGITPLDLLPHRWRKPG